MKWLNRTLLFTGVVFLAWLVWKTGPGELWRQVAALGWGVIPLILSEGLGNLAHTVAWRYCMTSSARPLSLLRLFRMAMAGYAINYLTPTASLGGEVTRASLLTSAQRGPEAVTSVLLDKLMSAFAHMALAAIGAVLLLWGIGLPRELSLAMVLSTGLLTCGMVGFLLLQKHGQLAAVFRWLAAHRVGGYWLRSAAERMAEVDSALKEFYRRHPWNLMRAFGWHMLGHSMVILQAWLFLRLLKQPALLPTVAAVGLLSLWFDLLTFAIPLNLGTLEGSRVVIFKALGSTAVLGMAFGMAVRVAQGFWACFGLVCYGFLAARRTGAPRRSTSGTAATFALATSRSGELQHKLSRESANDA